MARRIIWSHEAATDLEALARYIAKDSAFYATAFVREILEAARSLKEFAHRGRVVPEVGNLHIRELFVKEYRLIYRMDESQVVILGLVHGKRDLGKLWEREKRGD